MNKELISPCGCPVWDCSPDCEDEGEWYCTACGKDLSEDYAKGLEDGREQIRQEILCRE